MRFLVVSDIHCLSKDIHELKGYNGATGSSFYAEERINTKNPIAAIKHALSDEKGSLDAILCLGDLTHQSKILPLMQVWRDLNDLAATLGIREVISITGNHDIKTRADNIDDASTRIEFLRQISPLFPNSDPEFSDSYFLHGVASKEIGNCCLIAIDTCRTHGLGSNEQNTKDILEKGHISDHMRQLAINAINTSENEHVIIIMHHHPMKVDEISDLYPDAMTNGAHFIESLGLTGRKCLVMHGHKHQAHLKTTQLGTVPPIIFSTATFASLPYPSQISGFYNLFHIVEFGDTFDDFPSGEIYSWSWTGTKWVESKHDEMPFHRPFGKDVSIPVLTAQLKSLTFPVTGKVMAQDLFKSCPDLKYFKVIDVGELNKALKPHKRRILISESRVYAMMEE